MNDEYSVFRVVAKNGFQWEVRGPDLTILVFDEREEADMVCSALNAAFEDGYRQGKAASKGRNR